MTALEKLPQSGYFLDKVYANHQHLLVKRPPSDAAPQEGVIFGWDWEIIGDRQFEVRLQVGIDPTPARFEEARITVSGRFRVGEGEPAVTFENFVKIQAVAILFPYARETLTTLTSHGFYGAYYLPSVNVVKLMADKDFSQTVGAKQLRDGRAFLPGALAPAQAALPAGATKGRSVKRRASHHRTK